MHNVNIAHGDLTPWNIVLTRDGAKIANYGLAQALGLPRGVAMNYRPPETVYDETNFDRTADMWSFGCILAELYRRGPLFEASTDMQTQLR